MRAASRKLDAVGYEKFIESAVVSSVRRDLFRDRSKPCGARGFATNRSLEFTLFYFGKFLTMCIGWVQSQRLQGPRPFVQKELRATHFEEIHVTKPKSPKRDDHVLHEILLCDAYEPQPPSQWGYGEGDESRVGCVLWFIHRPIVLKLEVLESPMKYKICRQVPFGSLRARHRRFGDKWPKHRRMIGIKLDT